MLVLLFRSVPGNPVNPGSQDAGPGMRTDITEIAGHLDTSRQDLQAPQYSTKFAGAVALIAALPGAKRPALFMVRRCVALGMPALLKPCT